MSCGHCISSVTDALEKISGVTVDAVTIGQAVVRAHKNVDREHLVQAIEELGFDVVDVTRDEQPEAT